MNFKRMGREELAAIDKLIPKARKKIIIMDDKQDYWCKVWKMLKMLRTTGKWSIKQRKWVNSLKQDLI